MPECSFHPGTDAVLRCAECGRWICPKDMVDTPVGYKCPICSAQPNSAVRFVKPKQWAYAAASALAAGVLGGVLLGMIMRSIGLYFFLIPFVFGVAVGEATRRGSGGHRGSALAALAGLCAAGGAFLGGFGLLGVVMATLGAVVYLMRNSL